MDHQEQRHLVTRGRSLLPALLSFSLILALLGSIGQGLPSLHGAAHYGLAVLDAAIAAPEREGVPRGQAEGREDGPGDGLPAVRAADLAAEPDTAARLPRDWPTPTPRPLTASARAPPLPLA